MVQEPSSTPSIPKLTQVELPSLPKPKAPEKEVLVPYLTAELYPSAVIVQTGKQNKVISYDSFLDIVSGSRDSKDGASDVGIWFPPNVYTFSKTKDSMKLGMYYPGCVERITFRGDGTRPRVLPNTILSVQLSRSADQWKVTDARYYCTKFSLQEMMRRDFVTGPSASAGIWLFPFTNIYNDGRMCYGSAHKISQFTLPDLRGLHSYYRVIMDSEFNSDLDLYALSESSKFRYEKLAWFDHLANLAAEGKPFPYSELRT